MIELVEDPLAHCRKTIRDVFTRAMSNTAFPLSARLFSMACFAFSVDMLLDEQRDPFPEQRFGLEIKRATEDVYERLWVKECIEPWKVRTSILELPLSMIHALLSAMPTDCRPDFRQMLASAAALYTPASNVPNNGGQELSGPFFETTGAPRKTALCATLAKSYQERLKKLNLLAGPEMEAAQADFCHAILACRDYTRYASLFEYTHRIVIDAVLFKFFLAGNPDFEAIAESGKITAIRNLSPDLSAKERRNARAPIDDAVGLICLKISDALAREEASIRRFQQALYSDQARDLSQTALLLRL